MSCSSTFWELLDEILDSLLFILIGVEVPALNITSYHLLLGLMMIPMVLLVRMVSVGAPSGLARRSCRIATMWSRC